MSSNSHEHVAAAVCGRVAKGSEYMWFGMAVGPIGALWWGCMEPVAQPAV
jgi:hypothetical protein